ncbi:hypothetical protein D3C72_1588610 [compost metagenome]
MAIQPGARRVILVAQLYPRNVAQAHQCAAAVTLENDVAELLRRLQARLRFYRGGQLLIGTGR